MGKVLKRIGIALLIILLLAAGAFYFIFGVRYFRAGEAAQNFMESTDEVTVTRHDSFITFDGPGEGILLLFYPGARVQPEAYAPVLFRAAKAGVDSRIYDMPLHLAILDSDRALMDAQSFDGKVYIGGHSLGGMCAAELTVEHPVFFDGLILIGSRAARPVPDIPTLSIQGDLDGLATPEKLRKAEENLPDDYVRFLVAGGNHAQFGDYGKQPMDNPAAIEPEEQWRQTADAIALFCAER